jgi:hypothetical protein
VCHCVIGWGCVTNARVGRSSVIKIITHASQQIARIRITLSAWARAAYSGRPALRRPSVSSFALDCPPRAIHADIVKPGVQA